MLTSIDLSKLKKVKGTDVFVNCGYLTTVVSLENLDTFEQYDNNHGAGGSMFESCIRLKTAPISNKLKRIPWFMFAYDVALENIGDPSGLESIEDYGFNQAGQNTTLSSANFSNVKTLGARAFSNSGLGPHADFSGLTTCTKRGGGEWSQFDGCKKLISINISSLNEIPSYCFQNCSNLETVTVSTNLTRINGYAFNGCSKLNNLVLPSSLTYIGDQAFSGCNSLKRLIIEATTPPETHGYALISMPLDLIVYVPSSAVSAYSNAPRWSSKNIQPITSL